jgi:diphthamide synthase (EF-2-diphthine--ammonia ligase)
MPIWGESTSVVAREFVARGGEALLVTVRPPALDQMWLGAAMTDDAIARLEALGVDPCGEFGEYHTVVTSCPRFSSRLDLVPGERVMRGGCWALDFTVA